MWQFILADRNQNKYGEITNATARRVALPLSKISTCSFQVRLDHPLADRMSSNDGFVHAYRNGVRQFVGPIISAEEVGDHERATLSVNCADAAWYMAHRVVTTNNTAGGVQYTNWNRIELIYNILAVYSGGTTFGLAGTAGEIDVPTSTSVSSASVSYFLSNYTTVLEAVQAVCTASGGADWRMVPPPATASSLRVGQFLAFDDWTLHFAGNPNEAVFEWGCGRNNLAGYSRKIDRETQANSIYNWNSQYGSSSPAYPVINTTDAVSINKWSRMDAIVNTDLTATNQRTALNDAHIAVRKNPRQILSITPHIDPQSSGRLPRYGIDYEPGTFARVRIAHNNKLRLDAKIRIWGVTFDIDDLGIERQTLTLMADGA